MDKPKLDYTKFGIPQVSSTLPGDAFNKMLHEIWMKGHVNHAEYEYDEFGVPTTIVVYYDYLYPVKDENNG